MIHYTDDMPGARPLGCSRCGETFYVYGATGTREVEFCEACDLLERRDRAIARHRRKSLIRAAKREAKRQAALGKPRWTPLPEPDPEHLGILGALRVIERLAR